MTEPMATATSSSASTIALGVAIQAGEAVLIWGDPGVGKTSTITAVCKSLTRPLEVVIGSICEPTDIGGLPVRTPRGVEFVAPGWAVRVKAHPGSVVLFDELTTVPHDVQAAMLSVILERRVGSLHLPENTTFVGAANPPASGGTRGLTPALANRFCHLNWPLDAAAWSLGLEHGFPAPSLPELSADWLDTLPLWAGHVAAFIRRRPDLLMAAPTVDRSRAWPSPRSWTMAARLAATGTHARVGEEVAHLLISGCVGQGPALEFASWLRTVDLTDPREALDDPFGVDLPHAADRCHALLDAVTGFVEQSMDEKDWRSAWELHGRVARERGVDVAVVTAMRLAKCQREQWLAPPEVRLFAPVVGRAA